MLLNMPQKGERLNAKSRRGRGQNPKEENEWSGKLSESIYKAYTTPGHPAAFGNSHITRHFKPHQELIHVLESIPAYTKYRIRHTPKKFNPFIAHKKRKQVQLDLIDISNLKDDNNGVKYLLVAIDIFTKKASVQPMTKKSAAITRDTIKKALLDLGPPKPDQLVFDRGTEFTNKIVEHFVKTNGIVIFHPEGEHKAAVAERFNRTIQSLIYKYLETQNTKHYLSQLPKLVQTYNSRWHRTIRMSPNEAEKPVNSYKLRALMNDKIANLRENAPSPNYKKGDHVRLKKFKGPFKRGYNPQSGTEIFIIKKVQRHLPIPVYTVVDKKGELVTGDFYEQELQRVSRKHA